MLHTIKKFFLTFIIPLCDIHDVGDFLSPRKQTDVINQNCCLMFILEEWDAGYGSLVPYKHPWGHLVTVHTPPLAKDAETREKNKPIKIKRSKITS